MDIYMLYYYCFYYIFFCAYIFDEKFLIDNELSYNINNVLICCDVSFNKSNFNFSKMYRFISKIIGQKNLKI